MSTATPHAPDVASRRRVAGFAMIEVLIALLALAVAGAAVTRNTISSVAAAVRADAAAVAVELARGLGDRILTTPIDDVVGIWGPAGSEGPTSQVEIPDGSTATITVTVVTDEADPAPDLVHAFGLPRDLNGDGDAVDPDVSAHAQVLPVLIDVRWGVAGSERLRLPVVVVR